MAKLSTYPIRALAKISGVDASGNVGLAYGSVYNVKDYGWLPDGANHSTEALALLATVSAAGGGTLFFPAGTYRADSQLFIPNDGATGPNNLSQKNFSFIGAGGGQVWGRAARDSVGAAVLDLRYTASDGNAKIESRGAGSLLIENLTLVDGGAPNATPFVHVTNTTLTARGNTFIGSGHASQDAIVLGGPTEQTAGNGVGAPFQGYGTIIDSNHFRKLNRGVYGLTWSNSVVVTNNSWLASTGTRAIEFASSTGQPPDIITGLYVAGNIIEMSDPMMYGVVLQAARNSYFANSFYDAGSTYVSDYRLALGTYTGGYSGRNVFEQLLSGGKQLTVSTADVTALSLNTTIGATPAPNPANDGNIASLFAGGMEISGIWAPANASAGALNIRDQFNPTELLCLGATATERNIDAWSSNGFWRPLVLQPRGGPVVVNRVLAITPTALSVANGTTNSIGFWASDATNKSSFIRITGPTGAFSLGGFSNQSSGTASYPGSVLTLYNSTAQAMTLLNENGATSANNRIKTLTGANVTLRAGTSAATLIYDDTDLRWVLIATN